MRRTLKHAAYSLAVTLGLAVAPSLSPELAAQEEQEEQQQGQQAVQAQCQLQPSGPVSAAVEAMQRANNAQAAEEKQTAYREAVDALQPALAESPAEGTPYVVAAQAHVGLGNYAQADSLLNIFIEKKPECEQQAEDTRYNAWVQLYNVGIQAYQAGNTDEALESFETANLMYDDPRSFNNAAILYQQRGETEKAIDMYRQAVNTDAGEPEQVRQALSSLSELLRAEGRGQEVVQMYRDYLVDNPDDVVARVDYALALRETGQQDSAAVLFEEAKARPAATLTAEQWVKTGVGLYRAEQYADAVDAFTKARQQNPFNKEAMENLVSAAVQTDQVGQVTGLADTLVTWYPYDEENASALATVLSRSEQSQQALQTLQTIESSPITFQNVQMAQANETTWVVQGTVTAREAGATQTFVVPFEFLGPDGSVVASQDVTIQAPAAGESRSFQVQVTSEEPIAGFRYTQSDGGGQAGGA